MIGDPSGRSDERNLLDDETLARNLAGIRGQLERFVEFGEGGSGAMLVDNATWTGPITLLDFLRDVGKHVTVNQMAAKESVRSRLEGEEGISYTEFTYMLLQANDYLWLHEQEGCELQIGGSDQWGNITSGIDLIRRRTGNHVHGLTWPLLLRSDGKKFGKSQAGNLWLAADRTSPYAFYQYWIQVDDRDIERFLLQLTLLEVDAIAEAVARHAEAPHERAGQRLLAREVTTIVHGPEACAAAEEATGLLFGGSPQDVSAAALSALVDEVPSTRLGRDRLAAGVDVGELFAEVGLVTSRSEARRTVTQGAAYVNNARAADGRVVGDGDLLHDRFVLLRKGKRQYHLVVAG